MKDQYTIALLLALCLPALTRVASVANEAAAPTQQRAAPTQVSIIQLISNPGKYDGQEVSATGCLEIDREHAELYLGCSDYANALINNAVGIAGVRPSPADTKRLNGKYAEVRGTFVAQPRSLEHGTIEGVQSYQLWSDPKHPRSSLIPEGLNAGPRSKHRLPGYARVVTDSRTPPNPTPLYTTTIQLIANPKDYNRLYVSAAGCFQVNGGREDLFVHCSDRENELSANAVRITGPPLAPADIRRLNGKYVQVYGTFRAVSRSLASGVIENVRTYRLWSDPGHPRIETEKELLKHLIPKLQ